MREGTRLGVSGGASLHGPKRRPRGVGRGLRWIVCSVIAGQWPVFPACGHRTRREAIGYSSAVTAASQSWAWRAA